MRGHLAPWLGIMLLTLLAGCMGPQLAPTPALDHPAAPNTLTRLLTFTPHDKDDDARQLLGVIRLMPGGLQTVVATPTGQRLFTLVDDAQGARYTQTLMKPPFPAAWLAARLEWGLWPAPALADAWQGSDWTLATERDPQGRTIRHIRQKGRDIVTVTYDGDQPLAPAPVYLDDHQAGYTLTIAPLPDEGTP
ncbi:DUF3261 domain-containing protein [Larsenimonas rhizosphaerae]|uniref:DUF3261 domain-containing protein n=1 Tax=Larsenimonas rhizosphaerae TaxID=2944682 RepID=UPI002033E651|nr:DUF3261 domain-containing protein [Larsenimonas rhizosphaerae]MCM2131730.1 DUF3261 domain-containing protein [Larsenimonas rhizosphaerae]